VVCTTKKVIPVPNKGVADAQSSSESSDSSSSNIVIGVVGTLVVVVVGVFVYRRNRGEADQPESVEVKQHTWVGNPSMVHSGDNTYDVGAIGGDHTYEYDETPGAEDLYAKNPWDREGPVQDSATYDLASGSKSPDDTTYLAPTPLSDQGLDPISEEEEDGPVYDQALEASTEQRKILVNGVYEDDEHDADALVGSESEEEEDQKSAIYSVVNKDDKDKFDI
jgi:hypothetical protein